MSPRGVKTRRVLVTGGAGFIGSHLTARLRTRGHSVVVLDSLLAQVHGESARPKGLFQGDVRDTEVVTQLMAGIDVVYHLAAETGVGQSQYEIARYVSTNAHGFAVVLQAAVEAGVEQVILASSRAVYGEGPYACHECGSRFLASKRRREDLDAGLWNVRCPHCRGTTESLPMAEDDNPSPTSVYGLTKVQQEGLAAVVSSVHDLPVSVLRLFNVFGPGQSLVNPYTGVLGAFVRRVLSGGSIDLYEDGLMSRDFVFIDDVVNALESAMGNEATYGAPVNVGSGAAITLAELANALCNALGVQPKVEVSGRFRVGDVRHAVADTERVTAAMGESGATTLADGMKQYTQWAQSHVALSPNEVDVVAPTGREIVGRAG